MSSQTVIITGASRGLGAAAARILAELGARVVLNARSEGDLNTVAGSIRAAGGQAIAVAGDISQPAVSHALVETALSQFGGLDAIVNNAGVIEPIAPVAEADADAWQRNLTINVIAPVLLTQAAIPALRERQGRVINVSSGAAIRPKGGWAAYGASKAALNLFNATLALEEPRLTAIALRPGVIDTEMQAVIRREGQGRMSEAEYERFARYHAQGQLNPPELPGRALAVLALYAPPDWNGAFMAWDDERVAALVAQHAGM